MNTHFKKIFLFTLVLVLTLVLTGCTSRNPASEDSKTSTKNVLCASFPEYDWTKNIIGDNPGKLNLQLLNQTGADMHSYQPSVSDMTKISDADLLIYTGGISEFWVDDASLSSMKQPDTVLSLMEYFEDHSERFPAYIDEDEHEETHDVHEQGHEDESGHEHTAEDESAIHDDSDSHAGHHHSHDHDADEHLWLSLKITPVLCEKIADQLSDLDPDNADIYLANAEKYIEKLQRLDAKYQALIDDYKSAAGNLSADSGTQHNSHSSDHAGIMETISPVLIFADRYPFTYMMQDYGITAYAAFSGCSAETEASFHTVIDLADKLNTLHLSKLIVLKNSSNDLSEPIIQAAERKDITVLALDSIQSVTTDELNNGYSYLKAMEANYDVLAKAFA